MKTTLFCLVIGLFFSSCAHAQRDPPVWECYVASTTITHGADFSLNLDLLFKKEGGPYKHAEHQMYLIAYLKQDEEEVLRLAADKSLLDKTKPDTKMFLDVLKERQIATVLATQVRKRAAYAAQDNSGKYADGSNANRGKASLKINTFPFEFSIKNQAVFDSIAKLKNFDLDNVVKPRNVFFKDTFKFLLFVPVNDCKYATNVSKAIRGEYDFANYNTDIESNGEMFYLKTPVLYCRPLPFEFQLMRANDKHFKIYIN